MAFFAIFDDLYLSDTLSNFENIIRNSVLNHAQSAYKFSEKSKGMTDFGVWFDVECPSCIILAAASSSFVVYPGITPYLKIFRVKTICGDWQDLTAGEIGAERPPGAKRPPIVLALHSWRQFQFMVSNYTSLHGRSNEPDRGFRPITIVLRNTEKHFLPGYQLSLQFLNVMLFHNRLEFL